MAATKRPAVLDEKLIEQALEFAGPGELSRLMNDALRRYLQAQRMERLEVELAREFGPITPAVWAWAEGIEWPR
jgi:hypothetical protein